MMFKSVNNDLLKWILLHIDRYWYLTIKITTLRKRCTRQKIKQATVQWEGGTTKNKRKIEKESKKKIKNLGRGSLEPPYRRWTLPWAGSHLFFHRLAPTMSTNRKGGGEYKLRVRTFGRRSCAKIFFWQLSNSVHHSSFWG